jgi:ribosomal protein L40E
MRCITCDTENKSDALYCRICGSGINRCVSCDALTENDARYCRRCGKPTGALHEGHGAERVEAGGANDSKATAEDEVDFTTKVAPRRVEPIPQGLRRGTRAALYASVVLVLAGVLAAVFMLLVKTQAMQQQIAEQRGETRKLFTEDRETQQAAIFQEMERRDARNQEEIRKNQEEIRKATIQDIARANAKTKDDILKTVSEQYATVKDVNGAIAQGMKQERDRIAEVLDRSKPRNGESKEQFRLRLKSIVTSGAKLNTGDKSRWRPQTVADHHSPPAGVAGNRPHRQLRGSDMGR